MTTQGPDEPDETQPFTHRPYGERHDEPFASPSGTDRPQPESPAWPTYGQPTTPVPETPAPPAGGPTPTPYAPPAGPPNPYLQQPYGQPPYGQPAYGQPPYGVPPGFSGYGQAAPGYSYAQSLGTATTSMVLGIVALVSLALTPFCCVTLPGLLVGPFALWTGWSAKREIDRNPGAYNNRGQALAGFIMGIVASALAVLAVILIIVFVGSWSSSYNNL
ncbi:DUF4190 domain-containing protein [Nocardioides sp. 503]|uniref:DUF4190 domain-containing protein n=1 Tax=Nocardioides sp. 503 TaxID=2508326 RepID=UPI00107066FD|nr:DUF4190 domain-containing protein [Nocardioides sp. 503]